MQLILDWLEQNRQILTWIGAASLIVLIASLIALPWVIARIPADHFVKTDRPAHSLWIVLARNLAGGVLILGGIAMLILPGQGLLTIAAGVILVDYPRKIEFEAWLISKPAIGKPLNWLRRRRGAPPFELPGQPGDTDAAAS